MLVQIQSQKNHRVPIALLIISFQLLIQKNITNQNFINFAEFLQ